MGKTVEQTCFRVKASVDNTSLCPICPGANLASYFCLPYLYQKPSQRVQRCHKDRVEADLFDVGIRFPNDYLRRANPFEVLTWPNPPHAWHPNIRFPAICVGRLLPGTCLTDILLQVHEIITYR